LSVPDPTNPYPLPDYPRYCMFLRPTITSEKVDVGEYTATLMAGTPAKIAEIAGIATTIPCRSGMYP
jgi:hypothetical protein